MDINQKIRELTNAVINDMLSNSKSAGVTLASVIRVNYDDWEERLKPTCMANGVKYHDQIQKILAELGIEKSVAVIQQGMSRHKKNMAKAAK